jgi:REP element-mobilizing transposase RayT
MPNTYHQIYIQTVFPVKYRNALIKKDLKNNLQAVIGKLIDDTGCKTIIVNGVDDHIHCLFSLKPSVSVSDVMMSVKSNSSKWINEGGYLSKKFEWQKGFGCFSYSRSHLDAVYKYIENQQKHHEKISFHDEYIKMLQKHGIDYDERYLFQELK